MKPYFKNLLLRFKGSASKVLLLLKTTVVKWWLMDPFRQSAIIAYYAIFSLPALLVIVITVAGLAFGADAASGKIFEQVKATMGSETADQIKEMLVKATHSKMTIWATVIGVITMLLGSIGVFVELQKTMNIIWEVEGTYRKGIWGFLRSRIFSFGLILAIAFLLIISLVISTVLAAVGGLLHTDSSKFFLAFFNLLNFIISLGVISLLFALMFKYLPDAKITWRHIWLGALLTGIFFTIGKTALAFYFGKAEPGSGYGAAGSIILILLWTSYSSMILFLGAEFTHTYANIYCGGVAANATGKNVQPK